MAKIEELPLIEEIPIDESSPVTESTPGAVKLQSGYGIPQNFVPQKPKIEELPLEDDFEGARTKEIADKQKSSMFQGLMQKVQESVTNNPVTWTAKQLQEHFKQTPPQNIDEKGIYDAMLEKKKQQEKAAKEKALESMPKTPGEQPEPPKEEFKLPKILMDSIRAMPPFADQRNVARALLTPELGSRLLGVPQGKTAGDQFREIYGGAGEYLPQGFDLHQAREAIDAGEIPIPKDLAELIVDVGSLVTNPRFLHEFSVGIGGDILDMTLTPATYAIEPIIKGLGIPIAEKIASIKVGKTTLGIILAETRVGPQFFDDISELLQSNLPRPEKTAGRPNFTPEQFQEELKKRGAWITPKGLLEGPEGSVPKVQETPPSPKIEEIPIAQEESKPLEVNKPIENKISDKKSEFGQPKELPVQQESATPLQAAANEIKQVKLFEGEKGVIRLEAIPGFKTIESYTKEIIHLFAPRVGVNRSALDKIMEMKGARDKIEFELEHKFLKLEDMMEKLPKEKTIKFIDDIKLGNAQPTKELQTLADIMRSVEDRFFAEVQKFNPGLDYLENHFRVFWKQPELGKVGNVFRTMFRRPLEGTKGFMRAHVFDTISQGIELGLEPISYNPVTLWRNHIMDMQKFITARQMFEAIKGMNFLKFVKTGNYAPDMFVKLEDKIAKVYFPAEIKYSPEGEAYSVPHQIGEYYIEENVGRIINNFLSKDWIRASEIGKSLLAFKNMTTAFELSLSPFHASYESGASVASQIGLGYQKIWRGDFAGGISDILTSGLAPKKYASLGGSVIRYIKNPAEFLKETKGASFIKQFPNAMDLINDAFTGGMKFSIHQDYKLNSIKALKEGLKNKDYGPVIFHSIPAGNELIMKPLFEIFIPRLKLGTFLKEMSEGLIQHKAQLQSGEMTRPELARRLVDSVENRFGEMNFDNLFWNRTFKSALQLMIRSVTWKVGAIKNVSLAIPEQMAEIISAIKTGRKPILESNFAYLLGVATLVTAFASVIQKLYLNEWPKDFKDFMAPRYDKDGNRIMLNTHLKDWIHIAHSPINFLSTSSAGYIGRMIQLWQNKDFYGTEIIHEDDPVDKKAWDALKHMLGQPFVISSTIRSAQLKSPKPLTVSTMLGVTQPAPKYIGESKAEELAIEIQRSHFQQGARTQKEADRSLLKSQLRAGYRADKNSVPLSKAVVEGKITQKEKEQILKSAKLSLLERTIETGRFTIRDVARVYKVASPKERKIILPILKKKLERKLSKDIPKDEEMEDQALYKKYFGHKFYE